MKQLITTDLKKCVGCNRCVRVCPVEEANIAYIDNGVKIRIDESKCIACGTCIKACCHGSRSYLDDTEQFFEDLRKGVAISVICAPSVRTNLKDWEKILTLLRGLRVRKIYDVSLGADICTWGHIRYIRKYHPISLITQPCPVIVDYILIHNTELVQYLSPIQSPMLCTAIYMRKYQKNTDKIAAISPCIAKSNEFEETDSIISYNITFTRLQQYIEEHDLRLPEEIGGFDHQEPSLGSIFPMPGGLKENISFMLDKRMRIDTSEGAPMVYRRLDEFSTEHRAHLPAIFDVLNCKEGCNLGTGSKQEKSFLEINTLMDKVRRHAVSGRNRDYFNDLYAEYDNKFNLDDFIRKYVIKPAKKILVDDFDIEEAFVMLGKLDEQSRSFNCKACGSDTCKEMATKIAKKVNTIKNCIQKAHADMKEMLDWQTSNIVAVQSIVSDFKNVKTISDSIVDNVADLGIVFTAYKDMTKDIENIASHVHMISLNASIEASHAGQYGKSFAVVANAVRKLADDAQSTVNRIKQVSKDVKTTLDNISTMVVTISDEIIKSNDHVNEIATKAQKNTIKD